MFEKRKLPAFPTNHQTCSDARDYGGPVILAYDRRYTGWITAQVWHTAAWFELWNKKTNRRNRNISRRWKKPNRAPTPNSTKARSKIIVRLIIGRTLAAWFQNGHGTAEIF